MDTTFEQFLAQINTEYPHRSNIQVLRYGQKVMNHLAVVWPEKYKEITGTKLDCFYVDSFASRLLQHLAENWGKEIERPYGLTVKHIKDRGFWDLVCDKKGLDLLAVEKGWLRLGDFVHFSPIEWETIGLGATTSIVSSN